MHLSYRIKNRRKHMKKFISIFLLICILSGSAITASAAENKYTHTTGDISIITPDSFESAFSVKRISKVSYDYLMVSPEGASNIAVVALQMELKIAGELYTVSVSGTVNGYELPSGDILWEGPISTAAEIANKDFTVTAGFTKLESSEDVLISVTLQNDSYDPIAFSFGKNIIKGEVLDLFKERASSGAESASTTSLEAESTSASSEGAASTNGISPRTPSKDLVFDNFFDQGGSEYPNLGENGEYVFQSIAKKTHSNSTRMALETRVYKSDGLNEILVTLQPYIMETYQYATSYYVNTLGYNSVSVSLKSFNITLALDTSVVESKRGRVAGYRTTNNMTSTSNGFEVASSLFSAALADLLALVYQIPTATLQTLTDEGLKYMRGSVTATHDLDKANIDVVMSAYDSYFDDLSYGFPVMIGLEKASEKYYVGPTPYTVSTSAKYLVLAQYYNSGSLIPSFMIFYVTATTSHSGTFTIT